MSTDLKIPKPERTAGSGAKPRLDEQTVTQSPKNAEAPAEKVSPSKRSRYGVVTPPDSESRAPRPGDQERSRSQPQGEAIPPTSNPAETLRDLVNRVNKGDPEARRQLHDLLDSRPEIWQTAGDLSLFAEGCWLELVTGSEQFAIESTKRFLAQMKKDLAGAHPTMIETLLIDQIAACWLESKYHQSQTDRLASPAQQALRLRHLESSQKRYLSSIKSLAQLRALMPQGLVPLNRFSLYGKEKTQTS